MILRGIRGATTIEEDRPEEIIAATRELLEELVCANQLDLDLIASVLFTVTPDLRSAFPAQAARLMGWNQVPLLCFQEIDVPEAMERCIRVLIHVNTDRLPDEIKHIYMGEAKKLREDL